MVTRTDYSDDLVSAARSVLLELGHLLDAYQEHMAVVGGWVPELLLPAAPIRPVGTLDVDVALNHRTLHEASYNTIHELLVSAAIIKSPSTGRISTSAGLLYKTGKSRSAWTSWLASIRARAA